MNLQAILRYLSIGFLFLVPFVGLLVADRGYFPYITGKNIAFRLLIDLAAISYGSLLLYEMLSTANGGNHVKYLPRKSWVLVAFGTFVLVLGVANIFGENFTKSFWSNFERMEGYITFIHLGLYLLMMSVLFTKEVLWRRYIQTIILASVCIGIDALSRAYDTVQYQFVGRALQPNESFTAMLKQAGQQAVDAFNAQLSNYRLEGALGNSTYIGAFAMLSIFLTTFLVMRILRVMSAHHELGALDETNPSMPAHHAHKHNGRKESEEIIMDEEKSKTGRIVALVIYGIVMIFNFYILFHSGTRSAMLGLAIALAFAAVMLSLFEKRSKILKRAGIVVVALMIVSAGTLFVAKDSNFVQKNNLLSRFSKVFTTSPFALFQTEGKARTGIWGIAWQGFKERPVLGWGQDNFNFVFNKYYNPALYDQEQWFDRAHDVFFDWMIAGGLLGILSYLGLYAVSLYAIWKKREHAAFNFEEKVVLTSLLIGYFVHNLFVFDSISSYIVFMTFLGFIYFRDTTAKPDQDEINESTKHHASLVKNPSALLPLFPAVILIASIYFVYAGVYVSYASSHDLITAMQSKQDANNGYKGTLQIFRDILERGPIGATEVREQLVNKAVEVLRSSVDTTQKSDWNSFVRSEYDKQIAVSPNDARTYLFYASYLQSIGDIGAAEKNLKLAIQNSPGKQTMYYELGSLYLGQGIVARQDSKSDIDASTGKAPTAARVAQLKEQSDKMFAVALEQFKKAVDLYPLNPEAYQLLAITSAYADKLDISDKAIETLFTLPSKDTATKLAHYSAATDERLMQAYIEIGRTKDKGFQWLSNRAGVAVEFANAGDKATALSMLQGIVKIYPEGKGIVDMLTAQIKNATTTIPIGITN